MIDIKPHQLQNNLKISISKSFFTQDEIQNLEMKIKYLNLIKIFRNRRNLIVYKNQNEDFESQISHIEFKKPFPKKMKLESIKKLKKVAKKQTNYSKIKVKPDSFLTKDLIISKNNNDKNKIKILPEAALTMDNNCNNTECFEMYIQEHLLCENKFSKEKENKPLINYIDPIENYPGNYHSYVSKSLKSVIYLNNFLNSEDINSKYLNYLNSKKITLGRNNSNRKKTLIIDLDETLVHSDFSFNFEKHDEILNFKTERIEDIQVPLILRPGVKSFLQNVANKFEIVVFTASRKEYANAILDYLDPENNIFSHRLYRESCIPLFGKIFIKDLRIISDRYQSDMVIVDNSIYSFTNQISNGVLITSFFSDPADKELYNLENYLINTLSKSSDITFENEKFFKFSSMMAYLESQPYK